jgi:alpha-glucosidase
MKPKLLLTVLFVALLAGCKTFAPIDSTGQVSVKSPDGRIEFAIRGNGALVYSVSVDGKPVLTESRLGLTFKDGQSLGANTRLVKAVQIERNTTWKNPFGNRSVVRDHFREVRLTLEEQGTSARTFGLIVRAYDDGVAFRYDLPEKSGFVLTDELTEFRFAADYRCWAGGESECAENEYPETKLSAIPSGQPGKPHRSVLPLVLETPAGYFAIAESDVLDWAGMSLAGTGTFAVKAVLDGRSDGKGLVVSAAPRVSPWRVLMFGPTAPDLVNSDLIATLATPSRIADTSWIKPGACAWDAWWTGNNPYDTNPQHQGVATRGTTPSHKEYIDFAAEMGWPYQLMDWYWYEGMTSYEKSLHSPPNEKRGDFRRAVPAVNVPELVQYARSKKVRLFIWAHSLDLETFGVEEGLKYLAEQGFAGVKVDFLNSQSQETVQWCEKVLTIAARYQLLINFHGAYKPTGLARTYPNYITQEGVLGNEWNKFGNGTITPQHTINLAFTRALLGPMDFTPGGFINRAPKDFKITTPTQVMGTRARQLAMTVIYPSPMLVLCDSPKNYRGQPGVDFLKIVPTVWDDTRILGGAMGEHLVLVRRRENKWFLGALTDGNARDLAVKLDFLGKGSWTAKIWKDAPDSDTAAEHLLIEERRVTATAFLNLHLAAAGGAVVEFQKSN